MGRQCQSAAKRPTKEGLRMKDEMEGRTWRAASLAAAALITAAATGHAQMLSTSAAVRPNNSLIVDVQVTTGASTAHVLITYQTQGVDPLVTRFTQVSATG